MVFEADLTNSHLKMILKTCDAVLPAAEGKSNRAKLLAAHPEPRPIQPKPAHLCSSLGDANRVAASCKLRAQAIAEAVLGAINRSPIKRGEPAQAQAGDASTITDRLLVDFTSFQQAKRLESVGRPTRAAVMRAKLSLPVVSLDSGTDSGTDSGAGLLAGWAAEAQMERLAHYGVTDLERGVAIQHKSGAYCVTPSLTGRLARGGIAVIMAKYTNAAAATFEDELTVAHAAAAGSVACSPGLVEVFLALGRPATGPPKACRYQLFRSEVSGTNIARLEHYLFLAHAIASGASAAQQDGAREKKRKRCIAVSECAAEFVVALKNKDSRKQQCPHPGCPKYIRYRDTGFLAPEPSAAEVRPECAPTISFRR